MELLNTFTIKLVLSSRILCTCTGVIPILVIGCQFFEFCKLHDIYPIRNLHFARPKTIILSKLNYNRFIILLFFRHGDTMKNYFCLSQINVIVLLWTQQYTRHSWQARHFWLELKIRVWDPIIIQKFYTNLLRKAASSFTKSGWLTSLTLTPGICQIHGKISVNREIIWATKSTYMHSIYKLQHEHTLTSVQVESTNSHQTAADQIQYN